MSLPNIPSSISTFVTPYMINYRFLTLNTPFVPTQISNLGLWLDGSDINGNGSQPDNNTAVTTWVDKSSNGFNATQATAPNKPTYSNSGVIFSNANNDTTNIHLISSYPTPRLFETFFAVINQTRTGTSATADLCIVRPTVDALGGRTVYIDSNNLLNTGIAENATTNRSYLSYVTVPLDKQCLITSWNSNGTNIDHYVNGYNISSIVSTTTGFSNTVGTTLIGTGNSNGYNGVINELIIYSNTLTSNQVFNVQNYLMQKWSITSLATSNFLPNQFENLGVWYDSADIFGGIFPNPEYGSLLSNWNDKSGNNKILSQFTTELMPTFTEDGVLFSNAADNSKNNGFISGYTTPGSNETIFLAIKLKPTSSTNPLYIIAPNNDNGRAIFVSSMNTMATRITTNSLPQPASLASGTINPNIMTLFTMTQSNSLISHYINGNYIPVEGSNSAISASNISFGYNWNGNDGFNGSIYEMIIYSNILSSNQRNVVEFYLRQKWTYNLNSNNSFARLNNVMYPLIQEYLLPSYNQSLPNSYQSTIYVQSAGPTINSLGYPLVSSFLSTAGIYTSKNVQF